MYNLSYFEEKHVEKDKITKKNKLEDTFIDSLTMMSTAPKS